MAPDGLPSPLRRALPWALLVLATCATFAGTLRNGHVWDDFDILVDNPETRDLGNLPRVLLSPDLKPPYYRPLPRALFLLEHAAFGVDPVSGHAVSVAFHLAAVLLLHGLGQALFRSRGPALAAALLWAVHPLGSEAVGFVSVRTTPMAAAFVLATLVLAWRGFARGGGPWPWLSGLAFLAALGCKEQAVMALPLAALLAAFAPRLGAPPDPRRAWRLAPLVLALAAYLAARVAALGGLLGDVPPVVGKPGGQGPWLLVLAAGKHAFLTAWPATLTVTHDLARDAPGPLLASLAAAAALTAWALARPAPARTLGVAWFWLALLPTLQVAALPSSAFAERHVYLAAPGLLLAGVDLARAALSRLPARAATAVAAAATLAASGALAARTVARNADWRDNGTLFASALAAGPSALAHFNLGNLASRDGDTAGAVAHWRAAVALDPSDADAWNQLGVAAGRAGRLDEARECFEAALEAFPGHPVAAGNLRMLRDLAPRPPIPPRPRTPGGR